MRSPRQEYWSGLPFPSAGDLPDPGVESMSPSLQVDSLPLSHLGSPSILLQLSFIILYLLDFSDHFQDFLIQSVLPQTLWHVTHCVHAQEIFSDWMNILRSGPAPLVVESKEISLFNLRDYAKLFYKVAAIFYTPTSSMLRAPFF